jgi:hypothetical protein
MVILSINHRLRNRIAILEEPEPHNKAVSDCEIECGFSLDYFASVYDPCFEIQQGDRIFSLADDGADADANRRRESAKVANEIGDASAPGLPPNPRNPSVPLNKPINIFAEQEGNRVRVRTRAHALKKLTNNLSCILYSVHACNDA